eukprot:5927766-Pyramimonas_sp.AAC.1
MLVTVGNGCTAVRGTEGDPQRPLVRGQPWGSEIVFVDTRDAYHRAVPWAAVLRRAGLERTPALVIHTQVQGVAGAFHQAHQDPGGKCYLRLFEHHNWARTVLGQPVVVTYRAQVGFYPLKARKHHLATINRSRSKTNCCHNYSTTIPLPEQWDLRDTRGVRATS